MTIQSVCMHAPRDNWTGSFSTPFSEQYTVAYLLTETDQDAGPVSIYTQAELEYLRVRSFSEDPYSCGALPIVGEYYETNRPPWGVAEEDHEPLTAYGEGSANVFCSSVAIVPRQPIIPTYEDLWKNDDGNYEWIYTATYEPPGRRGRLGPTAVEEGEDNPAKDPEKRPISKWVEFEYYEEVTQFDLTGKRLQNTVGEPFLDPPPTFQRVRPILVFRKNYTDLNAVIAKIMLYYNSVNQYVFEGWPAKRCLMRAPRVHQPVEENGKVYYPVEWLIACSNTDWTPKKWPNQGYKYLRLADEKFPTLFDADEVRDILLDVINDEGQVIGKQAPPRPMLLDSRSQYLPYVKPEKLGPDTWVYPDPYLLEFSFNAQLDFYDLFPELTPEVWPPV